MIDLVDFSQASILCGLLTVYLLLIKKNALRSFSDFILSSFILCQIWAAVMYLLIFSGKIVEVPFLYRSAAPFTFLIAPLGYLYVRSVLFNENKFHKLDLLHLLPFLFFFVNYIPFYLSGNSFKLEVIRKIISDKNVAIEFQLGLFPETIFHISRIVQSIIYLVLQWLFIFKFHKSNKTILIEEQIKSVIRWLKVFTWANTFILIGLLTAVILYFTFDNIFEQSFLGQITNTLLGLSLFVICTYLLINPLVLTGLPFIKYKESASIIINNEIVKVPFIYEDYSQEIKSLEGYFSQSKAYLLPNLSISQVAVEANIPNRDLSYIINNYYQKRFNDYLNEMRLTHFLSKIDANTLDHLTIEAIAFDSGFSSKTSFYRAFNRFYGCTPSEYLEKLNTAN